MSFNQFRLSSDILKGLKDTNIENPTPLQKKIFKAVQKKQDLVINTTIDEHPETGYLISLLNELAKSERKQGTRAVIIAGNKERAKKLDEWIWAIGYHASIESACFTKEGNADEQYAALTAGPSIIVATPGRLAELLEKGKIIFREVQQFIVDQAELIEDWPAIEAISSRIMGKCQRIFTAAKDSKELRAAEAQILNNPDLVTLAKKAVPEMKQDESEKTETPVIPKDLTQYYINVPPRSKISTLMAHLDENKADSVVIFTASRKTADRLYKVLRKSNRRAVSVHEQLNKDTFKERFDRFASNNVQHLLIGELSAADLPLEHATQVINYDVPEDVNEYKLRADLVGDGKATRILSLVSEQDRSDIQTICKSLGYAPQEVSLPKIVKEKISTKIKNGGRQKSSKQSGRPPAKGKQHQKKKPIKKTTQKRYELPRPTFDQLEGGRSGKPEKKKGFVGFIKELFK